MHRAARLVGSAVVVASVLFWCASMDLSPAGWVVVAAGLLSAVWLHLAQTTRRVTLAAWLHAAIVLVVLQRLHVDARQAAQGAASIPVALPVRVLLATTVFASLYVVLLLVRSSAVQLLHWVWRRLALLGDGLVLFRALALLVAGSFAAEFFFVHERTHLSYSDAKSHPIFAFHLPGTYYYAHATERVVRDTHQHPFQQHKPSDVVRIVLNGASTVGGFGLEPPDRPAEVLRELLADGLNGKRVEVLFIGVSGKYQLNEAIDAAVTLPHWSPDLVVSLNGYNEILYGESAEHFEGMPYTVNEVDRVLEASPLTGWLFTETALGAALYRRELLAPLPPRRWLRDPLRYEPPRYFSYLAQTAKILADARIPYAYAFCPTAYAWLRQHGDPDAAARPSWAGDQRLAELDRARRIAAAEIVQRQGQIPYDVMSALSRFATVQEAFYDGCHLTRAGVRALATDLARRIPTWLNEWRPARDERRQERAAGASQSP